jgi:hypothetical protein
MFQGLTIAAKELAAHATAVLITHFFLSAARGGVTARMFASLSATM